MDRTAGSKPCHLKTSLLVSAGQAFGKPQRPHSFFPTALQMGVENKTRSRFSARLEMGANLEPERSQYWIERSVGFSVESRTGPIGTVEEVPVGEGGQMEILVVRMRGRGLVIVPVQRVEAVLHDEKRIFLTEPA
jgi:hypothetical protein